MSTVKKGRCPKCAAWANACTECRRKRKASAGYGAAAEDSEQLMVTIGDHEQNGNFRYKAWALYRDLVLQRLCWRIVEDKDHFVVFEVTLISVCADLDIEPCLPRLHGSHLSRFHPLVACLWMPHCRVG